MNGKTLADHEAAFQFVEEALGLIKAIRRMDQLAALPDPEGQAEIADGAKLLDLGPDPVGLYSRWSIWMR